MKRSLLACLLILAACENTPDKKPKPKENPNEPKLTSSVGKPSGATPGEAKTPAQTPTPAPANFGVKELPGFDLAALPEPRRTSFLAAVNEAVSPCDRPETLAACVANKTECSECAYLARAAYRAARDISEEPDATALGNHLGKMTEALTGPVYAFDLTNTASKGQGPVQVVEFADFQCPHCADLSEKLDNILPTISTQATFYFKNFPLPGHTLAEPAARATLAAAKQGKFWEMHHIIFKNQTTFTKDSFSTWAAELGLNVAKFKIDMEGTDLVAQVVRDRKEGEAAKIGGTPTMYINGRKYVDLLTPEAIKDAVAFAAAKQAAPK